MKFIYCLLCDTVAIRATLYLSNDKHNGKDNDEFIHTLLIIAVHKC